MTMENLTADVIHQMITAALLSQANADETQEFPGPSNLWTWRVGLSPCDSHFHGLNPSNQNEWTEGEESSVEQDGNIYESDITPAQSNSFTSRYDVVEASDRVTSRPMESPFFAQPANDASLPYRPGYTGEIVDAGATNQDEPSLSLSRIDFSNPSALSPHPMAYSWLNVEDLCFGEDLCV